MDIYNVIDEITAKRVTKSETGDTRIPGLVIGTVTDNYDMQFPGRVCVQIPTRDIPGNTLLWARVISPYLGNSYGEYFLPEVGDEVVLGFEGGSIERPYVIGCIPTMRSTFVKMASHKDNINKKIVTKGGNSIIIEDTPSEAGQPTDRITIYTKDKECEVTLDSGRHRITIKDKDNTNYIIFDKTRKSVTVKSAERLRVNVGDGIKLAMNDQGGASKVSLDCKQLVVNASNKIQLNANTAVGIKGAKVTVEGQSAVEIKSQGSASVNGQVVNLG